MFIKDLMSYGNFQLDLQTNKKQTVKKKTKAIIVPDTVFCVVGMLFMFVLIMSLMIVKVSSTATYQNQTSATIRNRNIKSYNSSKVFTDTTTTTTERVETTSIRHRKSAKSPVSNRTAKNSVPKLTQSKRTNWKPAKLTEKKMRADAQQQARERLQMQQQQQQQQQYHHQFQQQLKNEHHQHLQKHPLQQQQRQEESKSHAHAQAHISGENAYLVEHAGDDDQSSHEQPIYGTWRTKARRPQAPLVTQKFIALENVTSMENASSISAALPPAPTPTTLAASAALTVGDEDHQNDYQKYHVYERLPRRSSTMTPIRNELNDQIPRPPRLTSRRPSMVVRRQYLETPINASYRDIEQKPKPFHFPYEGPMPEEFKKAEPERTEVNNIQEILQQLQLSGTPTRATPFVMLPTGLHIAGSYKNLKASGIANFFRNKRNKKPVQLNFPVPMPMPMSMPMQYYGAYQPPMYGALHQPYQRIAMDQFYPFKPRSPNEINLLAMQQQLNANRNKNKKKKKNILGLNTGLYGYNNSLYMQQSNQRPEHFIPNYPQQWLAMNATQKPKLRRIPFKLNLDIYPVLPPTKEHIPLPVRTPIAHLPNPYYSADYSAYRYPLVSPNVIYPYMQNQYNEQPAFYNSMRFRTTAHPPPPPPPPPPSVQMPQSSNMQINFPDQVPKYSQQLAQHQQQQQYQRPPMNPQQNSFVPIDCIDSSGPGENDDSSFNPNANQIMVHLNVFPKQKPSPTPLPSTNPFYNFQNRNTLSESTEAPIRPVEPRYISRQIPNDNTTQQQTQIQQRIARSDGNYPVFVDLERPIVAADIGDLPQPTTLVNNKLDTSNIRVSPYYDHIETRNNFQYDSDTKLEQMASEAKAASLFRFPVEDLIQFQVDDAL